MNRGVDSRTGHLVVAGVAAGALQVVEPGV